ncbi:MAG: NAD-dependent epimerase/dehydratase family protein [Opitutales bacterium]
MCAEANRPDLFIAGCGYVGRFLARSYLAKSRQVAVLTRNADMAAALEADGCSPVIRATLDEPGPIRAALPNGARCVACTVSSAGGGQAGYDRSYVQGQASVRSWIDELAEGDRPLRYTYTGSTSVYPQKDGRWVVEDDAEDPAEATGAVATLLRAEALALEIGQRCREGALVLRLAGIYGPGRSRLVDAVKAGRPLSGDPAGWLNLVHAQDAAAALETALQIDNLTDRQIFNVADGHPEQRGTILAWIADQLGLALPKADEADGAGGDPAQRLTARGRRTNRRVSPEAFQTATGWAPRYPSFREGLDLG